MNLQQRLHQSEQLDNPNLHGQSLEETLRNLQFINSFLGNVRTVSNRVANIAFSFPQKQWRIVYLLKIVMAQCKPLSNKPAWLF